MTSRGGEETTAAAMNDQRSRGPNHSHAIIAKAHDTFVVLNGVARIYVGAHNPLDVLGGAGLGLLIGGILNVFVAPVNERPRRAMSVRRYLHGNDGARREVGVRP